MPKKSKKQGAQLLTIRQLLQPLPFPQTGKKSHFLQLSPCGIRPKKSSQPGALVVSQFHLGDMLIFKVATSFACRKPPPLNEGIFFSKLHLEKS